MGGLVIVGRPIYVPMSLRDTLCTATIFPVILISATKYFFSELRAGFEFSSGLGIII